MNQLVPLPFTRCLVRAWFLSEKEILAECYLIAVEVVLNEAPRWTVLLENGAMFSSVPLHALCWKECKEPKLQDVSTYDCLGSRAEIVFLDFVRNWTVESKLGNGRYMFSIHFESPHYYQALPEQLKVMHLIERDDGNFVLVVNNQSRFISESITTDLDLVPISNRNTWYAENGNQQF